MTLDTFERWLDIAFKWWIRGAVTLIAFETMYLLGVIAWRLFG